VTGRRPAPGFGQAMPSERRVAGKMWSVEKEVEEAERSSSDEVGGEAPEPVRNVHWCQLGKVHGEFTEEDGLSADSSMVYGIKGSGSLMVHQWFMG